MPWAKSRRGDGDALACVSISEENPTDVRAREDPPMRPRRAVPRSVLFLCLPLCPSLASCLYVSSNHSLDAPSRRAFVVADGRRRELYHDRTLAEINGLWFPKVTSARPKSLSTARPRDVQPKESACINRTDASAVVGDPLA